MAGGHGQGGAASALFAATEPERVRSFVWEPASPDAVGARLPVGREQRVPRARPTGDRGPLGNGCPLRGLGELDDYVVPTEVTIGYGKLCRSTATPDVALEIDRIWNETDIRGALPSVRAPALLTELDSGDRGQIDYIASLMPNARVVLIPGEDGYPARGHRSTHEAIRSFLGLARPPSGSGRVLSTVLFTDIVDSTRRAAEIGDEKWKRLLADHRARTREELARHRGREVDTTGDGFLATFDGPARAVRCAKAIQTSLREARPRGAGGVHTGEVELVGDGVQGLAVHVGARVGALAGPSEVLVSSTVKDLVAGSGLSFEDAGEHELKGVPDRWRLYRVVRE